MPELAHVQTRQPARRLDDGDPAIRCIGNDCCGAIGADNGGAFGLVHSVTRPLVDDARSAVHPLDASGRGCPRSPASAASAVTMKIG